MKRFFLLALLFSYATCFELLLNTGRENDQAFAVLHLKNKDNFTCREVIVDGKNHFECKILGFVDTKLENKSFAFFDINFTKQDLSIDVKIEPKMPARMYNMSQELYGESKILNDVKDTNSSSFTFVFSREIPYIRTYDGLEFDIDFPDAKNPSLGAIDLDANPVNVPQSADINTFIRIKQEYEKENYAQVLSDSTNAINRYKNSIFLNEFMLYRLRAQNKLYTYGYDFRKQENLEDMVDEAKFWTRTFTSDLNFQEVLYIMMRSYMALEQRANLEYIVDILRNEHPNHYFSQLASLDYADYLLGLGDIDNANSIYNQIYYNTKDVDLATRAALSIAKNALNAKDKNAALSLINTSLAANPVYFSKDEQRVLELAKMLDNEKEYELSSQLYEIVFTNMQKNNPSYEETLRNLALALSNTNKYELAKKYLDSYKQDFQNSEYIALIKEASDSVFFNIPENNASFLHQKYQSLMKEYANEIAAKALERDVKLYFKENNDTAILNYKNEIEKYNNQELKNILERTALKELEKSLAADECLQSIEIFKKYSNYDIGQKVSNKKSLFECFKRTNNMAYAKNYVEQNRGDDDIYYDLQKAQFELDDKNYANAISLSDSVLNSRTIKSKEEEFNALYIKFIAQLRQDEYNNAMATLQLLQNFPMNYKMVELYHELVLYSVNRGLNLTVLTYAPKAIDYQNSQGVNVYSPDLEFAYLNTLQKTNQPQLALTVLKDLLKIKLNAEDRARALYTQSEIFESLNDRNSQVQSLKTCVDINATSNWRDLCSEKLSILN